MTDEIIECPKCGKNALSVEHPDEYEVWLKCSECDYFRAMSKDEWRKLANSPNRDETLHKYYKHEMEDENGIKGGILCRGCSKTFEKENMGPLGFFCKKCWYKFLIVIFVLMVIASYMVWMMRV